MENYIGTKLIRAEEGTYFDFLERMDRSNEMAGNENQPGYIVQYQDANGEFGDNPYTSFSPKDVFEEAYRKTGGLSFGLALEAMKKGKSVKLPSWSEDVKIQAQFPDENSKMTAPYLYVESRYGKVPWKETMIELFSDDWMIVD